MEHEVKRILLLAALALLASGCTAHRSVPAIPSDSTGQEQKTGGSPAQGFDVDLAFSEGAKKTLSEKRETVVVAGYITGAPKPGAPKRYVSEMGEITLGRVETEVPLGSTVSFNK